MRHVLKKLVLNRVHMNSLVNQARMMGTQGRVLVCIAALDKKACAGALPNGHWYRPVLDSSGGVVGYIVGRGVLVASNLSVSMVPKGTKV